MAIFGASRGRWRRPTAYGGRTLPLGRAANGRVPPVREEPRLWPFLIVLGFYLALVATLNFGEPPLDIRRGEVARRDYRARVTFTCPDLEATEQQRTRKADREPSVYRFSPEGLEATRNSCIAAIHRLFGKSEAEAPLREGEAPVGLSKEQLAVLRDALTPLGEAAAVEGLKRVFAKPPLSMVIRDQEFQNEINEYDHLWISVIMKEGEAPSRISIYDTVPLEEKLPAVLAAEVSREFPALSAEAQNLLTLLILERFRDPTLQYSEKETKRARERARAEVEPLSKTIAQGETILSAGSFATEARMVELDHERRAFFNAQPVSARIKRLVGSSLLLGVLCFGFGMYMRHFHGAVLARPRRLALMATLSLIMVLVAKALAYSNWPVLLVPVPFVAVTLSLLFNQRIALGATALLAMIVGIVASLNFNVFLVLVIGGLVAAIATASVRTRAKLLHVGFQAGVVQAVAVWAVNLAQDANIGADFWRSVTFMDSCIALGNGVLSGFLITGILPFIERTFGVVTEISLLEWSDVNRPVLRRLVLEAPGTYHHSVLVANLAEAAAEAVGANSLLARTAAYYHDIGKLLKPEYFVENSAEAPRRHEKLSPALSALIIIAHARDGAQIAEEFRIPRPIRDIIEQHHGTTLMEFFYHVAIQKSGNDGNVDPECFRYRGPRPQTPEASIVLLADAVESASRVMSDPTPSRIESLVREITQKRLADGQFDECPITLQDLRKVEQSLIRELTAMFHTRIRYPRL